MKQVNFPLDVAKQMYNSGSAYAINFAKANYTVEELEDKGLPKTWKELEVIKGFFTRSDSTVKHASAANTCHDDNKCVFATEEQAEASIALAQLSQLVKAYNGGWTPDWKDRSTKYAIYYYHDEVSTFAHVNTKRFLTLKTEELSKEFLKNFKDLIEQAKPLL